jgi:putative Holliday junction resolvase
MTSTKLKEFDTLTLLAIDYGSKVVGTAKFTIGRDPYPLMLEKIVVKNESQVLNTLTSIIENEAIDVVIVGVPYFLDGKESEQTIKNKAFATMLTQHFPHLKIFEQDETLTTKEAEERMKNSPQFNFKIDPTQIDCLSAVIILEDFLKS